MIWCNGCDHHVPEDGVIHAKDEEGSDDQFCPYCGENSLHHFSWDRS